MKTADVVVIGGGAFGAATPYHRARRGAGVLLIEQHAIGSQTSARAFGLTSKAASWPVMATLRHEAGEAFQRFEEEMGRSVDFPRSGSLKAAYTEAGGSRRRARHRPRAVRRLARAIQGRGGLHRSRCRAGGAILPFTRVTGIRRDGHCVAGVATTRGDVATPTVVDAAGGWTRVVARAAGLAVPLVTVRHQLYITEPIAGVLPLQPIGPSPRADRLRALRRWRGHVRGLRGRSPSHPAGIAPTGVPGGRPGARHRRSPSPDRRGGRTTFPSSAGRRWPSTAEVSPR